MSRHLRRVLRKGPLVAALLVALGPLTVASSATALPANPRAFSCTGSLGEAFTQRTVAGLLTAAGRPYEVTVTQTASGLVESTRHRLAADRGPSWLHAGYTEWDVTGPNPDGNLYWLSLPPVLPGAGGYRRRPGRRVRRRRERRLADPDVRLHDQRWPRVDGPPPLPRSFSCTGTLGENTMRTVTGLLNWNNRPYSVTVTQTGTGVVESYRAGLAGNRGPSARAGYRSGTSPEPTRTTTCSG
ncbi:MAG: hypothetical protein R2734_09250 [Nocardioides sp.]